MTKHKGPMIFEKCEIKIQFDINEQRTLFRNIFV